MRVLVVSDSHGRSDSVKSAVQKEQPDMLLHLGDGVNDVDGFHIPIMRVRGNCDFSSSEEDERLLTIDGVKVLMAHGHRYSVKMSLTRLDFRAREVEADVCLFGHTHAARELYIGGTLFLNPGSIASNGSYAVLELTKETVHCRIKKL